MKKLLSFSLAVIMIASLFTVCSLFVYAEGEPAFDAEVLNADGTKIADLNFSDLKDFGSAGTKMADWDGYTIKLLKDITTTKTIFFVGNITIDGNGHQIAYTGTEGNKNLFSVATDASKLGEGAGPSEYKTVKIKNLKATTTGMILIPYFANVEFGEGNDFAAPGNMFWGSRTNGGKLTFTGGKYTNLGNTAIFSLDFRTFEVDIRGGEFSTSAAGAIINQTIECTVNISGGSFSSTNGPIIQMNKAGSVNISGGKFVLSGGNVIINMLDAAPGNLNVNIYDGYFYSTSWNRIMVVLAGTMNVYGGIFRNTNRGDGDLFTVRNAAKLNIYGGTIINVPGKAPVQNVNNSLYYPDEAKLNPIMRDGATVSYGENSKGLYFVSTFSKPLVDFVNSHKDIGTDVKYGTIIMPTNNIVEGFGFTLNELNILGKEEGKDYVNIEAVDTIASDGAGGVKISSALENIKKEDINLAFSAISYLQYTKDGHNVYIYSVYNPEKNSCSVFEIVAIKPSRPMYDAHRFSREFEFNSDCHWRICSCGAKAMKGPHYFEATMTIINEDGTTGEVKMCRYCHYKEALSDCD